MSRDVESYLWSPILIRLDIGHVIALPNCHAKVAKDRPAVTVNGGNEWLRSINYSISVDLSAPGEVTRLFQTASKLVRKFPRSSIKVYSLLDICELDG